MPVATQPSIRPTDRRPRGTAAGAVAQVACGSTCGMLCLPGAHRAGPGVRPWALAPGPRRRRHPGRAAL